MPERRYSDDDVHRILSSAVEVDAAVDAGAGRGLTLAQIQSIAAEAGLSPAAVAAAADALDRTPPVPATPRMMGLPVGVAQSVAIPGTIDDAGWRRLVAFLRDSFEAQGREELGVGRREWRNGNLRIALEDVGGTTLLHMRTRKENARALIRSGGFVVLGSAVMEAATAFVHAPPNTLAGALAMALGGVTMAAVGLLQLPAWSAARSRQFEAVAEFARQLSARPDE
jgi:hypothetical protein